MLSTYTHHPVIFCPLEGVAEACKLRGELTLELLEGVEIETVGLLLMTEIFEV